METNPTMCFCDVIPVCCKFTSSGKLVLIVLILKTVYGRMLINYDPFKWFDFVKVLLNV